VPLFTALLERALPSLRDVQLFRTHTSAEAQVICLAAQVLTALLELPSRDAAIPVPAKFTGCVAETIVAMVELKQAIEVFTRYVTEVYGDDGAGMMHDHRVVVEALDDAIMVIMHANQTRVSIKSFAPEVAVTIEDLLPSSSSL
jgi:hypothetical protein